MMFRFPSVICTRCTGFFCLAIIKGPPNDIYCIIEEPYKHYFTEKVSYSPEILHFLFTGESEYIQFAGKYNISLYDEFSQKLENKLIDEFYSLNQKQFCDDLENFTDYFLSEHTILLKTYIYDILDSFTAEKLKDLIFK